jgi:D-glycero-D-manno-heptose 1,7-bisphosphate phosphatase
MSNTAVFFDRDGTLVHDPGYINHPDQVHLLDGAAEAVKELALLGYKTVVVSNQSGVARGIIPLEMLEPIHDRLRELLAARGAVLDGIYFCPYHPDGVVPEYRKESDWRKPQPGMLLAAAREMDIDLTQSWMVGDNERDIEAGRRAGCRTILIRATPSQGLLPKVRPDHVAVNMKEAVNLIKKFHRSQPESPPAPVPLTTGKQKTWAAQFAEILSMAEDNPPEESGPETAAVPAAPPATADTRTEQLLASILEQLRRMQKTEMFGEFSLLRVLAGILQVFVPFCLLLALWLLMRTNRQDSNVFLALGFAAVLQLMAVAFYIMHGHR